MIVNNHVELTNKSGKSGKSGNVIDSLVPD